MAIEKKTRQPSKARDQDEQVSRLIDDLGPLWRRLYLMVIQFQEGLDLGPRGMWLMRQILLGDEYPSELANSLVIGPSLLSAELNRLVDAGMVVREAAVHDGRRSRVILTAAAKERLAAGDAAIARVLNPIFARFSTEEREAFFAILEALSEADLSEPASDVGDDRMRLRRLEAENKRLREMLASVETSPKASKQKKRRS